MTLQTPLLHRKLHCMLLSLLSAQARASSKNAAPLLSNSGTLHSAGLVLTVNAEWITNTLVSIWLTSFIVCTLLTNPCHGLLPLRTAMVMHLHYAASLHVVQPLHGLMPGTLLLLMSLYITTAFACCCTCRCFATACAAVCACCSCCCCCLCILWLLLLVYAAATDALHAAEAWLRI